MTQWRCPKCGTTIRTFVQLIQPPICAHNYRYGRNKTAEMTPNNDS
jgi:uncharacterized C2H2 Zn-finger protein